MPILAAEPDLYPPDLLDSYNPPTQPPDSDDDDPRWWCLHTKPRQEKATARKLMARGIRYYLPQATQESRTPKGRAIKSTIPLFPGYVFMYGNEQARLESLQTQTLVQVIQVPEQTRLVSELKQIHRMSRSNLPLLSEPIPLPGQRVRILDGPLRGLIGQVIRREQRDRFLAHVHFLGRGVSVEMHDWEVEPAN